MTTLNILFFKVSATKSEFSVGLSVRPQGCASFAKITGFNMLTERSMAKMLPQGLSSELSPKGPESVKNSRLFFSESAMLFGPLSAWPSKALMTGVISILLSVTV